MHVLFVIDSLAGGGAQRQAVELAVEIQRSSKWRVTFLVYHDASFFKSRLRIAGIRVVCIPKAGRIDIGLPRRIARVLRRERPDVIQTFLLAPSGWLLSGALQLRASKRPILVAAERGGLIATNAVQAAAQVFIYNRFDAISANSQRTTDLLRHRIRIPSKRLHYIPNGIDLGAWDRAAAQPMGIEGGSHGWFNIAMVGRLESVKNHKLLLTALFMVPANRRMSWRVWLIGGRTGGENFARQLEQQLADLELRGHITLCGEVPNVAAFLATMDVLVLPSRSEGFPNALLEAMASRVCAIAADVGDVPNMIEQGVSGTMVPPNDPAALAAALIAVSEMTPARRAEMGSRARRIVEERFQIHRAAERYLDLYTELLTHRRSKGRSMPPSAQHLFDQKAADWQRKYRQGGALLPRIERFRIGLAEAAPPPARLLDFGCGTGELANAAATWGYSVTACDFSTEMIARARSATASAVHWHQMDANWSNLPYEDASFDVVTASSVLEYVEDLPRTLAELARVLSPGGVLLATVPNRDHRARRLEQLLRPLAVLRGAIGPSASLGKVDRYLTYVVCSRNRPSLTEWAEALARVGLTAAPQPTQDRTEPLLLLEARRSP